MTIGHSWATKDGVQDVLPYFKKMENYDGGSDELRETAPLPVTDSAKLSLFDTLIKSSTAIGIKYNADYNGASKKV